MINTRKQLGNRCRWQKQFAVLFLYYWVIRFEKNYYSLNCWLSRLRKKIMRLMKLLFLHASFFTCTIFQLFWIDPLSLNVTDFNRTDSHLLAMNMQLTLKFATSDWCCVSPPLYNAVLSISNIPVSITHRHVKRNAQVGLHRNMNNLVKIQILSQAQTVDNINPLKMALFIVRSLPQNVCFKLFNFVDKTWFHVSNRVLVTSQWQQSAHWAVSSLLWFFKPT